MSSVNLLTKGTGKLGRLLVGKTLILDGAGAPVDGTTGAGKAGPGSIYLDNTGGAAYVNTGAKASPVWNSLGAVANGDIDETLIKYATVTLTHAQIAALRATPIELVAAPGANKQNQFVAATLNGNFTAGAYTETTDNLAIRLGSSSGPKVSEDIEAGGFMDQAAKILTNAVQKKDTILTEAQAENTALVLHNIGDGEFGGGNSANTLKVTVMYRVIGTL